MRARRQVVASATLPYLLSVPAETAEPLPLLCFLHGYDEAAPTPLSLALTKHGPLSPAAAPIAVEEFIIVAPQLPMGGDLWFTHADDLGHIVDRVVTDHASDPERTYLTGFSFGGNGVFDLALEQPARWAALWPVDPTRVPESDPGLPVWLSSGEVSRRRCSAFLQRLSLDRTNVDLSLDRVYIDEGKDHVATATSAYADDRIYRWLLAKRRTR